MIGEDRPVHVTRGAGEESPEDDLLERCARRAAGAWEEFLDRYRGSLERAARLTLIRVIGSAPEDDVEAVVEAALLGLVKDNHAALRAFSGRSSVEGYLKAITAKIALNHLRSERRKGWLRFRPLEVTADTPAPEPSEENPERLADVRRALAGLPPRDRLILELFHFEGTSYKEIASLMGISPNAVSPALLRARDKLRALFPRDR